MKKFDQYCANLQVLSQAPLEDLENEFILSGILNKFSLQFELVWKLLKELLLYEGRSEAQSGSLREILKAAFVLYDFLDEDVWLTMLKDRNNINHIYDGSQARRLAGVVLAVYLPAFLHLRDCLAQRYAGRLDAL